MPNVQNGTGSVLAQGVATTAAVAIYGPLADTNKQVEVRGFVLNNEASSATTITYGLGKAGSTLGAAGTSQGKTVAIGAAGTTTSIIDASELEYMILGYGDYVWVQAGANMSVAYTLDGIVY